MPLTDSFLLATNEEITVEFSGIYNLIHQTDESDNPQIKTLWLGSLMSSRLLQASSNPGVDQITISVSDELPIWEASATYAVGDCVQPLVPNGFRYRVVDAGTANSSEPVWPVVGIGSQVSDGTVIWELQSPKHLTTEITLALSEGDLDTNIAGDPLDIGSSISSGEVNAVAIWIKIENHVNNVTNTGTIPDLGLSINSIYEIEVP